MVSPPIATTITAPKLPTTPSRNTTDSSLVSTAEKPIVKSPVAVIPAPLTVQPKQTMQQLIEEHFVKVEDLATTASNYPWRGVCKKCGWQTYQFTKDAALQLVRSHAQTHWRDLTRFM